MAVVLLTLEAHQLGIWNTLLINRLEALSQRVVVVTLESTLTSISNPFPSDATLVVNRVSDATALYKATVAILKCCEKVWKIRVWNGSDAYGLLANKWCHSTLLEQAELASPPTQRVHLDGDDSSLAASFSPILFKPNAGGFGAGIIKARDAQELKSSLLLGRELETNDSMAVLQQYVEPYENRLYRVWFLRGKVQCGLIRQNYDGVDEFTTGCAAKGVCSIQESKKKHPTLIAYNIPNDVREEIEVKLLPLLPDAHCGSIEYLCNKDGHRLFFDINLLSTLPLLETVENVNEVWGAFYDPWNELAQSIVEFSVDNREDIVKNK